MADRLSRWLETLGVAQALEDFTSGEPLPLSDYFIARGRALARLGRGDKRDTDVAELRRLLDVASQADYRLLALALEAALAVI